MRAWTELSSGALVYITGFVLCLIHTAQASIGDRSYVFLRCMNKCMYRNCTSENNLQTFENSQPWYEASLGWSCEDECRYMCMWKTVEAFKNDGEAVPHFYGKWPFIRLFGMQEPASVIFSILNGIMHLRFLEYRKIVPSTTPMYYVWQIVAVLSMNTWVWSVVFHTKDTDFTEKMDYFCAFGLVLCNLLTLCCRVLGTDKWYRPVACFIILLCIFLKHIHYLSFVHFDYGYNMEINVAVGAVNTFGWVIWCVKHKRRKGVWKCAAVVIGLNIALSLELGEFPPIFWVFDAHSLWHAATFPLCYLWYSFIIEDGLYLDKQQKEKVL